MAKIYVSSSNSKVVYLVSEEPKPVKVYFSTGSSKKIHFISEEFKPAKVYFTTPFSKKVYLTSEPFVNKKIYLCTPSSKKFYFTSEELDPTPYPNNCKYPKELDLIRQKASVLIWDIIKTCLYTSTYEESYGKESLKGYNKAGMLRLLLDYLSSVWMEKYNDSLSGLARPSNYYYTTYSIKEIIETLKKCDLNVKDVVALFNLNSYTVIDNEWPNYFMMNQVINPPDEETQKQMKQYKDIYTTQGGVLPDSGQSIYNLTAAQSTFTPTKSIKYFGSFTINGVDYSGYIDYNANSVHYSPSALFGYTIQADDIVTITYWYEE
jgi:hypothetical protein